MLQTNNIDVPQRPPVVTDNNNSSLTSLYGKDSTLRYINISKFVSNWFFEHSKCCEHCSLELKKALIREEQNWQETNK